MSWNASRFRRKVYRSIRKESVVSPEDRLAELGIDLFEVKAGNGPVVPCVQTGNLLYLSGRVPDSGATGTVGKDLTTEEAYAAARECAIDHLSVVKSVLGDLNRITRVVKVLGMVNAVAEFKEQPQVINGYSDFMVEVLGDKGRHARSAVGMSSLPHNVPVEVEVILEVD
jgi:enamine deaminase RidA (YjgF/YER057c/UK114 family)